MKKIIVGGLLGGLSVLVIIIIFTNLFGVDLSTFYKELMEETFLKDIILVIFIALGLILAYNKTKQN